MALLKVSKLNDASSAELRIGVRGSVSGAEYDFVLKRKHIEVEQVRAPRDAGKSKKSDWFATLNDAEKTQVFALILSEYRNRSLGDNGFKGASIGAATDKLDGQTRLFIGTNTMRWASPYFKDCAEQNMVNGATDTLMYERSKKPDFDHSKPKPPQFKAVYVLQAVSETKSPIACPCGKCTDMLANVMVPGGEVVSMPFLGDAVREKLKATSTAVQVHTDAQSLHDIPLPGRTEKYEVWKTTIENLNRNRAIALSGKVATMQHDGLQALLAKAGTDEGLPYKRAEADIDTIRKQMEKQPGMKVPDDIVSFVPAFLSYVRDSVKLLPQRVRQLFDAIGTPAKKAAENMLRQRKSVAVLDCAELPDGGVDLGKLNNFMVARILDAVGDRMHAKGEPPAPGKRLKWLKDNNIAVRCVAIQLDDGTYRYAVQATGKLDAAMPNAGVVALEQASESLGRSGVRHVWGVELNPAAIENSIMMTSPKEEIERLMKRRSPEGIDFHYFPFNSGNLSHASAQKIVNHLTENEIYPTAFRGSIAMLEAPVKVQHRPWVDMVRGPVVKDEAAVIPTRG